MHSYPYPRNVDEEVLNKAASPRSDDLEPPHFACAMLTRSLSLLAALASFAIADVEFVTPAAGSTVVGAKTLAVAWKESGVKPPISSLTTYTMFLVAGGDEVESQVQIALGGQGAFSAGNTASGVIDITFGQEATNA
ncbi:hypothetical protein MMC31_006974 [Peltigera leucophlebia]|nr:hypothetical protein [Peltigera leucophlebia]